MQADCAVIIAYYDARESHLLMSLLHQIKTIDAGAEFDLILVVNQESAIDARKNPDLSGYRTYYRENTGFNIGAWQHGWQNAPGYRHYLFLQDECKIERTKWLKAFIDRSSAKPCVIGESLVIAPKPSQTHGLWPGSLQYMETLKRQLGLDASQDWTHVQTTIIFASAEVLESTRGFVVPDGGKMAAVACEVAFSMLVRKHGFGVYQIAFFPFQYIAHPQWSHLRARMKTPLGRVRRIARIALSRLPTRLRV
jgi:hypothetical protein